MKEEKIVITKEQRVAFLDDLIEVCKKHGLSIAHEDGHGGFLVAPYNDHDAEWLRGADVDKLLAREV